MADEAEQPSTSSVDVELCAPVAKKAKQAAITIDYNCCVICQKSNAVLHNIREPSVIQLRLATEARQDDVSHRLGMDLHKETFSDDHNPKWHPSCRNKYLLKSTYERIRNKRASSHHTVDTHARGPKGRSDYVQFWGK